MTELKKKLDNAEAKEKADINKLSNQLLSVKKACINQYNEIREALESIDVHVLPAQQRPLPSQLVIEDAVASQKDIAASIRGLIERHQRDILEEQKRQRAQKEAELLQQEADARARAQAERQAAIEAKKREEDRINAEKQAALQKQLAEEKEKQQREELKKRLERLIPAGVIFVIILLIILLKH